MKLLRDVVKKRSASRPNFDELYREWILQRGEPPSVFTANVYGNIVLGGSSDPSVVTIPVQHSVLTATDIRAQVDRLARARMREYDETT